MDTGDLNLRVEHSEDFWKAFNQENQLQDNSCSESEDSSDDFEDEQSLESGNLQAAPDTMQEDNVEEESQLDSRMYRRYTRYSRITKRR